MRFLKKTIARSCECQHAFKASVIPPSFGRRGMVCQALMQREWALTRRQLLESSSMLGALALVQASPAYAGLDRYVKRKKLDPLDTYVPLVLEARDRLANLGDVMIVSPTEARQLMRSGSFSGLRDNIRAVGQYAATPVAEGGSGLSEKDAQQLVAGFFRALEDFDLVLYNAVREAKAAQEKQEKKSEEDEDAGETVDPAIGLDKDVAAVKLTAAVEQLDKLIATVPADVLSKSKEVIEKVNRKQQVAAVTAAE